MDSLEAFVCDDELAYTPLRDRGWTVESVSWRDRSVDWDTYDLVVIRSTWDYQNAPEEFLSVLEEIEDSKARLENPLEVVRWNLSKRYLHELETRGVRIPTTVWLDRLESGELEQLYSELSTDELVLKPLVGANADLAFRLDRRSAMDRASEVEAVYSDRPLLAQPFLRNVLHEGEYSLFYFSGRHSHTILKTPREGDFRVQEEHGGFIQAVAAEPALIAAGDRAMSAIPWELLYARVDLVRDDEGEFRLMELELIEPALYFRMDPASPKRFADTIVRLLGLPGSEVQRIRGSAVKP